MFILCKGDQECYVLWSDSLILVTLIEVVCTDGSAVLPVFIPPREALAPGGRPQVLDREFFF